MLERLSALSSAISTEVAKIQPSGNIHSSPNANKRAHQLVIIFLEEASNVELTSEEEKQYFESILQGVKDQLDIVLPDSYSKVDQFMRKRRRELFS